MEATLSPEMVKLIEKDLPKHLSESLKQRLEIGETAERELEVVRKNYNMLISKHEALENTLSKHKSLDERNDLLLVKQKELDGRELKLDLEKAKHELECQKGMTNHATAVAMGLVRNITYRKSILDSENQNSYSDGHVNWVCPTPVNKSLDENRSAE